MNSIRMFQNRVLVESIEEEATESGIFVPLSVAKDGVARGKVLAIGESKIRTGETIIYSSIGAVPFKFGGKDLFIINENQIFAVLN